MKKLSDLSIADLVALHTYIHKDFKIATSQHNGRLAEKLSAKLLRINCELDNRTMEIEDFKDI